MVDNGKTYIEITRFSTFKNSSILINGLNIIYQHLISNRNFVTTVENKRKMKNISRNDNKSSNKY